jgi:hypothetical protein
MINLGLGLTPSEWRRLGKAGSFTALVVLALAALFGLVGKENVVLVPVVIVGVLGVILSGLLYIAHAFTGRGDMLLTVSVLVISVCAVVGAGLSTFVIDLYR